LVSFVVAYYTGNIIVARDSSI